MDNLQSPPSNLPILPFDAETLQFLERPLLMRLATVGADGYPQVTPVWFVHENGRLFTSTEKERIKARNIARDPRVGASIDADHPYRGISIKGIARLHEGDIRARVRQIAARYAPPAELDALVTWLFKGRRVVIEIAPVSVVKIGAEWHTF
jgi:PPOX class probable F420-dependent enzyme